MEQMLNKYGNYILVAAGLIIVVTIYFNLDNINQWALGQQLYRTFYHK